MPTHFPGGLSVSSVGDPLFQMPFLDPTKYHIYFNDFDHYVAADWTSTVTGTGTSALANADGGQLLITNSAANSDAVFTQKKGESFLFDSTKRLFMKIRFKTNDATATAIPIGLQITDTTPLAVSNGIWWLKSAAATSLQFRVENGTATTLSAGTLADNTFTTLACAYLPTNENDPTINGYFYVYQDGLPVGKVINTNAPTAQTLAVSFGVQNGAAVVKTLTLDYFLAALER